MVGEMAHENAAILSWHKKIKQAAWNRPAVHRRRSGDRAALVSSARLDYVFARTTGISVPHP